MHHNHHVRFGGGNFGTISLIYDRIFGTLDNGQGYGAKNQGLAASAGKPSDLP
jgi:sterol desaturase/sphingolipid hydroxylase (fatty acid hydroxylase superfamily)